MRKIVSGYGQSLVDIAVQEYGSADALVELCQDNGFALDDELQPGTALMLRDSYPETAVANYADYLRGNQIKVVSSADLSPVEILATNDDEAIVINDTSGIGV